MTLTRLVALAVRRPLLVVGLVGLLALAGAGLASRLHPSAAADTLVGRSSPSYVATARYQRLFGDDAVIVLVRERLTDLVLTADIGRLLGLEGCLSGNVPAGVVPRGGRGGPCAAIARAHDTQIVFGPATFINESAGEISDQLAAQQAAEKVSEQNAADAAYALAVGRGLGAVRARALATQAISAVRLSFIRSLVPLAQQYGLTAPPTLNDPDFVRTLVFDPTQPLGTPKARFSSLFPALGAAVVQVRLRAGLPQSTRDRAIGLIRAAVAMPDWRLGHGGRYSVTGVPVIASDLTGAVSRALLLLLVVAVLVMAATLSCVLRVRRRLLPLGVALAAAGLTFGGLAVSGAPLTMASVGVLPVLIGLAVDYAIQFQSRVGEARALGVEGSIVRATSLGGPTILAAAGATAAGCAVLALPVVGSPVPMVAAFGLLLVVGVALALLCAFLVGPAVLVLGRGRRAAPRLGGRLGPSLRGARAIVVESRLARFGARGRRAGGRAPRRAVARGSAAAQAAALGRPGRVLGLAAAIAAIGFGVGTQTGVESDIQKLVPQSLPALRDLNVLQRSTHVGGEIDILVSGADLTTPSVVGWMTAYQQRIEARFGYTGTAGCGRAVLCPAFSLPDLFSTAGSRPSASDISGLLAAVPPYFSREVITPDHRNATLAFGIRLMPLAAQQRVVAAMRASLRPPPGVEASLVGLPVLAADANAAIASPWRRTETLLAGLVAVALLLGVALRSWRRALVPLIPIVLAAGWAGLAGFLIRVPLNPMSVTLGALVVAIATEFSVLLSERYRQERAGGLEPAAALASTYGSTGAAVLASAATAIAGFAVLVTSDIRMLRDFGLVTVIDLVVTVLGVLFVLPSVLLLAEGRPVGRLRMRASRSTRPRSV